MNGYLEDTRTGFVHFDRVDGPVGCLYERDYKRGGGVGAHPQPDRLGDNTIVFRVHEYRVVYRFAYLRDAHSRQRHFRNSTFHVVYRRFGGLVPDDHGSISQRVWCGGDNNVTFASERLTLAKAIRRETAVDYPRELVDPGDVVWGDGIAAGLTEVTVTGSQTIREFHHVISVEFTGQSTQDYNCLLEAHTFSVGDSYAVPIRLFQADTSSLCSAGVIFTDGTASSSNAVTGHLQQHAGEIDTRTITRDGTLTAMSGVSTTYDLRGNAVPWAWIRLTYQASNTFRKELSVDGISWSTAGVSDTSKTMTPTHFGVCWSMDASTGNSIATFGPILKLA